MTTAALYASSSVPFAVQADSPLRSPQTSIILAELARQRRHERQQRRRARARRAAWLGWFDRSPFDSLTTQSSPQLLIATTMPLVYLV